MDENNGVVCVWGRGSFISKPKPLLCNLTSKLNYFPGNDINNSVSAALICCRPVVSEMH